MKYTIYQITYLTTGKIYIGKHQTKNLDDGYMGSGKILKCAISKHGVDNFKKEILHIFDTEAEMNAKEAELVTEEFCLREDTYNICVGGKGGFSHINILLKTDPETEKRRVTKMMDTRRSLGIKSIPPTKEWTNEQRSEWSTKMKITYAAGRIRGFLGKTHTEETKQRMKKPKGMGESNSQYGSRWITNGVINKKIKSTEVILEGWRLGRTTL